MLNAIFRWATPFRKSSSSNILQHLTQNRYGASIPLCHLWNHGRLTMHWKLMQYTYPIVLNVFKITVHLEISIPGVTSFPSTVPQFCRLREHCKWIIVHRNNSCRFHQVYHALPSLVCSLVVPLKAFITIILIIKRRKISRQPHLTDQYSLSGYSDALISQYTWRRTVAILKGPNKHADIFQQRKLVMRAHEWMMNCI